MWQSPDMSLWSGRLDARDGARALAKRALSQPWMICDAVIGISPVANKAAAGGSTT